MKLAATMGVYYHVNNYHVIVASYLGKVSD